MITYSRYVVNMLYCSISLSIYYWQWLSVCSIPLDCHMPELYGQMPDVRHARILKTDKMCFDIHWNQRYIKPGKSGLVIKWTGIWLWTNCVILKMCDFQTVCWSWLWNSLTLESECIEFKQIVNVGKLFEWSKLGLT